MFNYQLVIPYYLRETPRLPPASPVLLDNDEAQKSATQHGIYCASCDHLLSQHVSRLDCQGSHIHTRLNPAGVQFTFACFAGIEHVVIRGTPTLEHSWFHGYHWQLLFCQHCQNHLGWDFSSVSDCIYGLITNRIAIHEPH